MRLRGILRAMDPMTKIYNFVEEKEFRENMVDLKLIDGTGKRLGLDSTIKMGGNWLEAMQPGCQFLCKDKVNRHYVAQELEVLYKFYDEKDNCVAIRLYSKEQNELVFVVIPNWFCNRYDLVYVIRENDNG